MQNFHKNRKKFTKIFACTSLALITCATTLLAVNPFTPQTARASTQPEQQDVFNLHPETDPVIYTTESGLDIKVSLAIDANGVFTGYTYFTMGTYGGADVNWVIIGRHSETTSGTSMGSSFSSPLANFFSNSSPVSAVNIKNWINTCYENVSPQGSAIKADMGTDPIVVDQESSYSLNITLSSKEKVNDTDLEPGEVLCMSQKSVGTAFHPDGAYENSALQTYMNNLFISNLNLTDDQKAIVVPKTVITNNSYSYLCCLFPLAWGNSTCNFNFSSYLSYTTQAGNGYGFRGSSRLAQWYVDRSSGGGGNTYSSFEVVYPGGGYTGNTKACFVMKLT